MLDIIRNSDGSVTIREVNVSRETLADFMEKYDGTTEYNGIVADCQKWFYGSLVKAAWCSTFLCYAMNQLGILKKNLSDKHENVFYLYTDLKKHCKEVTAKEAKRGDIVVLNFSPPFAWNSNKHVTVLASPIDGSGLASCIGGNQSDRICTKLYSVGDIVGIFRPNA